VSIGSTERRTLALAVLVAPVILEAQRTDKVARIGVLASVARMNGRGDR
jgi:hypothetical protein